MTPDLLGQLVVLALIDSTSFGTLLIPLWFLLVPGRVRVHRVLVFLGTVAAFYLVVGVALLSGARAALVEAPALGESSGLAVAQLVLGGALLVWALSWRATPAGEGGRRSGRLARWRERAVGGDGGGVGALVGLALAAAAIELGSMLPYLGAVGLLTASDLTGSARVAVLAGYCLVMVLPALVLLAARVVAARQVAPVLTRLAGWLERTGGETTAWVVGIVGFLLARDALTRLPWVLDAIGSLAGS